MNAAYRSKHCVFEFSPEEVRTLQTDQLEGKVLIEISPQEGCGINIGKKMVKPLKIIVDYDALNPVVTYSVDLKNSKEIHVTLTSKAYGFVKEDIESGKKGYLVVRPIMKQVAAERRYDRAKI